MVLTVLLLLGVVGVYVSVLVRAGKDVSVGPYVGSGPR
jgi:hypothetical protein